jgi:hypothetical protein
LEGNQRLRLAHPLGFSSSEDRGGQHGRSLTQQMRSF